MNSRSDSSFRINLDEEVPASRLNDNVEDKKTEKNEPGTNPLDKLRRRFVFTAILVPCVLLGLVGWAYVDLRNKFVGLQDKGETGVQYLSQNIESRFSSLSVKLAKIEELIAEKIPQIEKNAAGIEKTLASTRKEIKTLAAASGNDKTEMTKRLSALDKSIVGVHARLETIPTDIQGLEKTLSEKISGAEKSIQTAQKDIGSLKAKTRDLASAQVNEEQLSAALKKERDGVNRKLDVISTGFIDKVKSLRKDMKALQTLSELTQKQLEAKAAATPPNPADKQLPSPENPEAAAVVDPGVIIEQDLP